jgi:hypothetical protein
MRFVFVVAMVIGCGGKPAPQPAPPSNTAPATTVTAEPHRASDCDGASMMWQRMCAYADKVCTCSDLDCITKAGEQWAIEAAELAKEARGKAEEMTDEEKRLSELVMRKITVCTKKVTDEMAKKANP